MTSKSKTILWVVIALIVIGVIWWYFQWMAGSPAIPEQSPYSQNSAPATSATSSSALPQGNSNTALDQSLQSIDSQLNGLSSDSANVTQGLSDQPISQGL